jgi:hypothetical protein
MFLALSRRTRLLIGWAAGLVLVLLNVAVAFADNIPGQFP